MQGWRCGELSVPVVCSERRVELSTRQAAVEEDRLLTEREVGVCIGGGDLVDGEFDYAGRNLTVEKDEGAGHAQPLGKGHRHVSIAAAVPSARHRRVLLGQAVAAQPVDLQICGQPTGVRPPEKVPQSVAAQGPPCPLPSSPIYSVTATR